MNTAQLRDWYEMHPSNTRERRLGTPTLAKARAQSIAAQTAWRVQASIEHQAKRDESEPPPRVYFRNRAGERAEAAKLHRRKFEALLPVVVPAYNAIETPTHAYSPPAKRREQNRRKRERRAR
jgi:hypothetical protein